MFDAYSYSKNDLGLSDEHAQIIHTNYLFYKDIVKNFSSDLGVLLLIVKYRLKKVRSKSSKAPFIRFLELYEKNIRI